MHKTFIDLDELILLCRDKLAKEFIREAVACYRAGAYRSCIVSTWNAVVFDFIHKLRQLSQVGNDEASSLLHHFETMSRNADVKQLWKFESDIPRVAQSAEFELISPIEKNDIERLLEDRSRCAHPSISSLEEPFEATAELARYHMRSAVMHLLQRPPVQGRSALARIWQDIESFTFPTDPNLAAEYFKQGLLASARPSLIKSIIIGLTVSLLTEEKIDDERERQFSGLNAVALIYPKEAREILSEHLSRIIIDKTTDENWRHIIAYLRKTTFIENLSDAVVIRTKTFIEKIDTHSFSSYFDDDIEDILVNAAHVNFLTDSVKEKLKYVSANKLLNIKKGLPSEFEDFLQDILTDSIEKLIQSYLASNSFDSSSSYASTICKASSFLSLSQKETILNAWCDNDQIHGSRHSTIIIYHLFDEDCGNNCSDNYYWNSFIDNLNNNLSGYSKDIKKYIISKSETQQYQKYISNSQ